MRVVIVDDEPIAIGILEKYVTQIDGLELAGACRNGIEAFNLLQHTRVDLLLLDIEMPGLNGLSLLKNLHDPPSVILTTAYRDYALESYDFEVADYLLKPIAFERFLRAIDKVRKISEPVSTPGPVLGSRSYLYFKSGHKMVQVYLDDVLYVEGMGNYARIFLAPGGSVVTYQKMSDLEDLLPAGDFVRIHRSYLVRRDKVTAYTPNTVEVGSRELPVGGNYKGRF